MGQNKDTVSLTERLKKKGNKQKGGGTKKFGRNKAKCQLYRELKSRKNKVAKLKKHLAIHVNDACAITAIGKL